MWEAFRQTAMRCAFEISGIKYCGKYRMSE